MIEHFLGFLTQNLTFPFWNLNNFKTPQKLFVQVNLPLSSSKHCYHFPKLSWFFSVENTKFTWAKLLLILMTKFHRPPSSATIFTWNWEQNWDVSNTITKPFSLLFTLLLSVSYQNCSLIPPSGTIMEVSNFKIKSHFYNVAFFKKSVQIQVDSSWTAELPGFECKQMENQNPQILQ